jgi:hypothetical protein
MEYWIMKTYLPIGIALYQANNTQLQHVAGLQLQIVSSKTLPCQIEKTFHFEVDAS